MNTTIEARLRELAGQLSNRDISRLMLEAAGEIDHLSSPLTLEDIIDIVGYLPCNERSKLFCMIRGGFCIHCGGLDGWGCQCQNDE